MNFFFFFFFLTTIEKVSSHCNHSPVNKNKKINSTLAQKNIFRKDSLKRSSPIQRRMACFVLFITVPHVHTQAGETEISLVTWTREYIATCQQRRIHWVFLLFGVFFLFFFFFFLHFACFSFNLFNFCFAFL